MNDFKPMLAGKADLENVRYPVVASPKFDGIRAIVIDGKVMSRKLIQIPNRKVQVDFSMLEGCDGELIVGDPTAEDVYKKSLSATATSHDVTQTTFYVFDLVGPEGYQHRLLKLADKAANVPNVVFVPVEVLNSDEELMAYEEKMCALGYEGIMLRKPSGRYKQGRSTTNEGLLLKVKRSEDSEAEILAVIESETNTNVATTDALGHTKRSTQQAGMIPSGTMGALAVRDIHTGVEFKIGTGFDLANRDLFWANKAAVIGMVLKYKFQAVGTMDKPRFPVYLGMRADFDTEKKVA